MATSPASNELFAADADLCPNGSEPRSPERFRCMAWMNASNALLRKRATMQVAPWFASRNEVVAGLDQWDRGSPLGQKRRLSMKIVVIGGTGLIGSKLVAKLREQGHDAVAASPDTGVNTLTGEGLREVLKGAAVVVDVSNSPSFEDAAVLKFFETSTSNLLTQEAAAGVGHHVALSVVGADRQAAAGSGYMRAKIVQEK